MLFSCGPSLPNPNSVICCMNDNTNDLQPAAGQDVGFCGKDAGSIIRDWAYHFWFIRRFGSFVPWYLLRNPFHKMPGERTPSVWFNNLHPRPEASCRLFCFPWCGGGSQFYARWSGDFANVEVIGIRFPGRESRIKETMVSDISQIIASVCEEIAKHYFDKPFSFFGHSMGTVFCYEAALYLKEKYDKEPKHLFLSSDYAPHSKVRKERLEEKTRKALHEYTDAELIERISKHGGTPKTFLENKDFMVNTFLPPYRNDLKMVELYYRPVKVKKISCPVTAFDGDRDTNHHLYEFSELTSGRFQQMKFPGHHFYLLKEENAKRLRDVITRALM